MNKELKQRMGWRHLYKDYSLLLLSTRLRFKPRINYLIQIIQAAQLVTLIIPPDNSKELPWNYSHFSIIWEWVSISVRINYLFSYIGISYINEIAVLLLILCQYLSKITLLYKLYKLRSYDLATCNLTPKLERHYMTYLEQYSRYLLFELGYIPFLINILSFNLHFSSTESNTLTSMLLLLTAFMFLCIEDSLFLQPVSWYHSPTSEFISDSRYILRKRVAYLVVLIITQFVNFKEGWYIYSAVSISVGWYVAYKFGMEQPYGDRVMNCIEVCKGVVILWGGIVMTLCVMNSYGSEDITGTLVYLLVMPFIVYLSFYTARSRYEKLITSEEDLCQTQLFHILLAKCHQISKQEREAGGLVNIPAELETRIKYFSEFNQDEPFFVLWLVYFFQAMKYKISVKILISILEYHLSSKLVFTYVNLLKNDLRELVINDPDENEAFNYICFTQNLAELLKLDEITCQSAQSFYRGLLSDSPNSQSLSKLILNMTESIITTENYYEYILNNFARNPLALHYYSGFLNIIKSSLKHKEVDFLAANSFADLKKRSKFDKDLKFFENDSCKMVVNLEQKNRGQILWITNANIYGYNDTFLTGTEFRQMIPEPVRKMHDAFFLRLFDIWSPHSVLTRNVDVFVLDKEGFIIASIYKARMTNLESGKLVVLAGLKPDKDGLEIAFLDQEGRYILNLTRNMNSFLSWGLKVQPENVKGSDIFDWAGITEWKTDVVICRNYDAKLGCVIQVKTYEFIIGRYIQKSLVMYRSGNLIRYSDYFENKFVYTIEETESEMICSFGAVENQLKRVPTLLDVSKLPLPQDLEVNKLQSSKLSDFLREKDLRSYKLTQFQSNEIDFERERIQNLARNKCLITVVISTVLMLQIQTQAADDLVFQDFIDELSSISVSTIKLGALANQLLYIDKGFPTNSTREDIVTQISLEIDNMHLLFTDLKDMGSQFESINNFLLRSMIYSRYTGYAYVDSSIYIIELLNRLSVAASGLISTPALFSNNSYYIEIYKNCMHHTTLNSTLFDALEQHSSNIIALASAIDYICLVASIISCVSICIFGLYPLYRLQCYRAGIWRGIFKLPKPVVITKITNINSRLKETHHLHHVEEVKSSKVQKLRYYIHIKQKMLYLVEVIMCVGLIGFILYLSRYIIPHKNKVLSSNVEIYTWMNMKIQLSYLSIFYIKELQIQAMADRNIANLHNFEHLSRTLANYKYIHSQVIKHSHINAEIHDRFYDTYNDYKLGYHAFSIDLYNQMSESLTLFIVGHRSSLNTCNALVAEFEKYINNTKSLKDSMIDANMNRISEISSLSELMNGLTILFVGVIVIAILYPLLSSYKEIIMKESDILMYLPKDNMKIITNTLKLLK